MPNTHDSCFLYHEVVVATNSVPLQPAVCKLVMSKTSCVRFLSPQNPSSAPSFFSTFAFSCIMERVWPPVAFVARQWDPLMQSLDAAMRRHVKRAQLVPKKRWKDKAQEIKEAEPRSGEGLQQNAMRQATIRIRMKGPSTCSRLLLTKSEHRAFANEIKLPTCTFSKP